MKALLFFPIRLVLSLLLSLFHFALLLGLLAFHLLPWAVGITVFMGGGGALAAGLLSLFNIPDGSGLWISGFMIGAWIIGPLTGAGFLHFSRPGRWLEHRWHELANILQQKVDTMIVRIKQQQDAL